MNILLPGKKTFSLELLFKNNLLCLLSLLILLLCSMPLAAANQYLFPDNIISSSQQSFYGDEFVNSDRYHSYDHIPVPPRRSSYRPGRQPVNNFDYASKPYLSKKPRYAIDEYLEDQQYRTPGSRQHLPYQTDRWPSLYNRSRSDVLYVSDLKPKQQQKKIYSREKHHKLKRYNDEQYSSVPYTVSRSRAEGYQNSREYNHYSSKQQLSPLERIRYVPVVVYQMPAAFSDATPGFLVPGNGMSGLNYPGSAFNYNELNNIYALKNIHNLKKLNTINMGNLVNPVSSQYNPLSSFGVFPEMNGKHSGRKIRNGYEHSSEELPFNYFNDVFSTVLPHSSETDIISSF